MSNTHNVTPLTVELSGDLVTTVGQAFADADAATRATRKAGQTAIVAFDAIKAAGIAFAHWASPGKDATPEHVADHAALQRLACIVLAGRLNCDANELLEYCYGDGCADPKKQVRFGRVPGYTARDKRGWQSAVRDVFKHVKRYADTLMAETLRELQGDLKIAKRFSEEDAKACEEAEDKVERQEREIESIGKKLETATAALKKDPNNAKARIAQVKHADTLATLRKGLPKLQAAFETAKARDASTTEQVAALEAKIASTAKAAGRKPRTSQTWEAKEADHIRKAMDHIKKTESLPFDAADVLSHYRAILKALTTK